MCSRKNFRILHKNFIKNMIDKMPRSSKILNTFINFMLRSFFVEFIYTRLSNYSFISIKFPLTISSISGKQWNFYCNWSESVKFLLIQSVICLFTDSPVKKYISLLNQLIITNWISGKNIFTVKSVNFHWSNQWNWTDLTVTSF